MSLPKIKRARIKARELISEFNISEPPTPIENITQDLNLIIKYSLLDDEISGMIYTKNGRAIIGINSSHHPNRQRFTLAHECGHYILHNDILMGFVHVDKKYPALLRSSQSAQGINPIEIEANQFAAELLVPEKILINELPSSSFDLENDDLVASIAKRFKVSTQMMSYRLANLRID